MPPFFGLGVAVGRATRPGPSASQATVAPWDRNPLLERVEAKRVDHLVAEFENLQRVDALRTADYVHRYRLIGRLLPMLDSRAFSLAERISAVRQRGRPNVSPRRPRGGAGRPRRRRHRHRADEANPEPSPEGYVVRAIEVPPATARPAAADARRPDLASEAS